MSDYVPSSSKDLTLTVCFRPSEIQCHTAEHQSLLLGRLKEEFDLTNKEQQVLSRGRNAVSGSKNNRRNPGAYQDATAFEALIGYLYVTDSQRCGELLNWADNSIDHV